MSLYFLYCLGYEQNVKEHVMHMCLSFTFNNSCMVPVISFDESKLALPHCGNAFFNIGMDQTA
jgi:hypothetical protein